MLEAAGRTFVERVVDAALTVTKEMAVLGPGDLPAALHGMPRIDDAPHVQGPMAGLLAALRADPGSAWLLIGCDMPRVTPEALRWLVARRSIGHCAVMPRTASGGLQPLLAVYEPAALALVEDLAARGGHALRPVVDSGRVVTPLVPPELHAAWTNINDRGELARLEESLEEARRRGEDH